MPAWSMRRKRVGGRKRDDAFRSHADQVYTPNPFLEGSKIDQKVAQNEAPERCPKGAPEGVQKCTFLAPRAAPERIP